LKGRNVERQHNANVKNEGVSVIRQAFEILDMVGDNIFVGIVGRLTMGRAAESREQ